MKRQNWLYGLMMGMTIGFALWGSVRYPRQETGGLPVSAGASARAGGVRSGTGQASRQAGTRSGTVQASGPEAAGHSGAVPASRPVSPSPEVLEAAASNGPRLHALSAVLIDGDTGRVLYAKDADTVRPMASTTKIMTCILALENGQPDQVCTVSDNAASQPKVHLGASAGTSFYMKDLLHSLMLESHNDSAVVIAESIAGSVEAFAGMMNQKARDIGCTQTHFVTPNGLDGEDGKMHATTARELALILRYCIGTSPRREEFLEITRTAKYAFTDNTGKKSYSCVNHNAFLHMMNGVLTGKTGFTGKAGYSYVSALKADGRTFVLALLGCGWPPHKTYKWEDTRALFQYGKDHYQYRNVYRDIRLKPVPVEQGVKEQVAVTLAAAEDEKLEVLLKEEEQVEVSLELPGQMKAPVAKGDLAGYVRYHMGDTVIRVYPVYAEESVDLWDLPYCICEIFNRFLPVSYKGYGS